LLLYLLFFGDVEKEKNKRRTLKNPQGKVSKVYTVSFSTPRSDVHASIHPGLLPGFNNSCGVCLQHLFYIPNCLLFCAKVSLSQVGASQPPYSMTPRPVEELL
jgi:hypothetical protein